MTVPIATSPGRSGFGPQLSLSYDSGAGNGPFGFGWSLTLPQITRKTHKGLPNQLARDLAVPPGRISGSVNGRRAISADTALRLGKYFGVSPETWIGLQADYDLRVGQRTTWPEVEKRIHTRVVWFAASGARSIQIRRRKQWLGRGVRLFLG